MKSHNAHYTWRARELAARWCCHPSSVGRIMRRFGISGLKFSDNQQGSRRYLDADVKRVEDICGTPARIGKLPKPSHASAERAVAAKLVVPTAEEVNK